MVRILCSITVCNRLTSAEMENVLGVDSVEDVILSNKLQWFCLVE
jgi:hypothetical protein